MLDATGNARPVCERRKLVFTFSNVTAHREAPRAYDVEPTLCAWPCTARGCSEIAGICTGLRWDNCKRRRAISRLHVCRGMLRSSGASASFYHDDTASPRDIFMGALIYNPKRMSIRLRTTIVTTRVDWSVARIELLADFLREEKAGFRTTLFAATISDTEPVESDDPFLSIVDREAFAAMWLAAIETGAGLRPEGCTTISQSCGVDRGLLVASTVIDKLFKLAMAFEASPETGRFIAECSFYHVAEDCGDHAMWREPTGLASVRIYVRNVATWLALLESDEWERISWNRSVTRYRDHHRDR